MLDPVTVGVLSVAAIFLLIVIGFHVGVALAFVSFVGVYLITGRFRVAASLLQTTSYSGIADYGYAVIPLFVVMGLFATQAGATRDLFDAAESLRQQAFDIEEVFLSDARHLQTRRTVRGLAGYLSGVANQETEPNLSAQALQGTQFSGRRRWSSHAVGDGAPHDPPGNEAEDLGRDMGRESERPRRGAWQRERRAECRRAYGKLVTSGEPRTAGTPEKLNPAGTPTGVVSVGGERPPGIVTAENRRGAGHCSGPPDEPQSAHEALVMGGARQTGHRSALLSVKNGETPMKYLPLQRAFLGLIVAGSLWTAPSFAQDRPTVAVVATGGTIAMKVDPVTHAPVPAVSGQDLIAAVPKLKEIANIRVIEFSNIPSDYMGPDRWPNLARKVEEVLADPSVVGVVISHGTDTLDQTAYFLDLTLKSDKPVVAVGAQRSASEWDTDGPRNLLNAVRQVLAEDSKGKGVTVTLNSYINAARYVRKSHTSNVQTFTSGDAGALGYVDEDKVFYYYTSPRRQTVPLPERLPRVDLLAMYAGTDGSHVRHAADTGAEAIVVEAYGWGNMNEAMHDAIKYAVDKGVPVIVATKVENGRALPVYGFKGGGKTLQSVGAVFAGDLSGDKARILTMLVLPTTKDQKKLQAYFDR